MSVHPYRCRWCKKTVLRNGTKAWVKSYCTETGRTVRLIRQPDPNPNNENNNNRVEVRL
jgi:phage FluMu protein Com